MIYNISVKEQSVVMRSSIGACSWPSSATWCVGGSRSGGVVGNTARLVRARVVAWASPLPGRREGAVVCTKGIFLGRGSSLVGTQLQGRCCLSQS